MHTVKLVSTMNGIMQQVVHRRVYYTGSTDTDPVQPYDTTHSVELQCVPHTGTVLVHFNSITHTTIISASCINIRILVRNVPKTHLFFHEIATSTVQVEYS